MRAKTNLCEVPPTEFNLIDQNTPAPRFLRYPMDIKDVCKLLAACEARVCRVIDACGLGEAGVSRESAADSIDNTTMQRRSFWHSGLNTATVPPGSEPATEGAGESDTVAKPTRRSRRTDRVYHAQSKLALRKVVVHFDAPTKNAPRGEKGCHRGKLKHGQDRDENVFSLI